MPFYFSARDVDGVIYPPYWNTGDGIALRQKKGSRTQSTKVHKNGNDSEDGITPLLYAKVHKNGNDSEDGITPQLIRNE